MDWYDKHGNQISFKAATSLLSTQGYKRIGLSSSRNVTVSTVWLGLDHSFDKNNIEIFETMVFQENVTYYERYSTLQEAKEGHKRIAKDYLGTSLTKENIEETPPVFMNRWDAILKDENDRNETNS